VDKRRAKHSQNFRKIQLLRKVKKMRFLVLLTGFFCLFCSVCDAVEVSQTYAKESISRNGFLFTKITNRQHSPVRLLDVSSDICLDVKLQKLAVVDGLKRHVDVKFVEIPPKSSVKFENEAQIVLVRLKTELKDGEKIPIVRFLFSNGEAIELKNVMIRK